MEYTYEELEEQIKILSLVKHVIVQKEILDKLELSRKALSRMTKDDKVLIDYDSGIFRIKKDEARLEKTIKDIDTTIENFAVGFANWLDTLRPSERVSMWSKDGSMRGLFTMDNEQLFDKYRKVLKLKEQSKYCKCSYQIPKAISETEFECVNCGKEIKQ